MEVFLFHSITQETASGGQLNIKAALKKTQKQACHYAAHRYFNKQNGAQSISDKIKHDKTISGTTDYAIAPDKFKYSTSVTCNHLNPKISISKSFAI